MGVISAWNGQEKITLNICTKVCWSYDQQAKRTESFYALRIKSNPTLMIYIQCQRCRGGLCVARYKVIMWRLGWQSQTPENPPLLSLKKCRRSLVSPNGVGITRQCLKSFCALLQGFFCVHMYLLIPLGTSV